MFCECGQKLILIGKIQGSGRMYLCLGCLEITVKDKYDKVQDRYIMDWFIRWHREKTTGKELVAKMASEMLGIREI